MISKHLLYHIIRYVGVCAQQNDYASALEMGFSQHDADTISELNEGQCIRATQILKKQTTVIVDHDGLTRVLGKLNKTQHPGGFAAQLWATMCAPLIEAFFRYVWEQVENRGMTHLTTTMGMSVEQVADILRMRTSVYRNINIVPHHCFNVTIPERMTQRVLETLAKEEQENATTNEYLRLGASRAMMIGLFGWQPELYQARRALLGLSAIGRPKEPNEYVKITIEENWRKNDETDIIKKYIAVANATDVRLNVIWRLSQDWLE